MAGGLMQLVAYGAQDVYLTGNPQITFWKVTYRRYTNFAVESIEQTFNGQADFGRRVTCTISRNGDLASATYLQVTLPQISTAACQLDRRGQPRVTSTQVAQPTHARWLDYPGEHIISSVDVEIGGQRIDRHYGDWMHIWNQLTIPAAKQSGYEQMIGNTTALTYIASQGCGSEIASVCSTSANTCGTGCIQRNALPQQTLYVPLQFWFCTNPGLALPLIALQYHEVKIVLDFEFLDHMLWAVSMINDVGGVTEGQDGDRAAGYFAKHDATYNATCLTCASLYVDYVFLDTDERRRMAQSPHEYLIEQLQFTGDQSIGSSANKIQLSFNHPVKELVWVIQPNCNVDYCQSFTKFSQTNMLYGAQPFNYTDSLDGLPRSAYNYRLDYAAGAYEEFSVDLPPNSVFSQCVTACVGPYCGHPTIEYGPEEEGPYGNEIPEYPGVLGVQAALGVSTATQYITGCIGPSGPPACGFLKLTPEGNQSPLVGDVSVPGPACNSCSIGNCPTLTCNPGRAVGAVVAESSRGMHCWGANPMVTGKLLLNGQDRFSERLGSYFDLVQPFQHHTRTPDTGINVYSFALKPEEHQPSGTCNFSRIDNASLSIVVSANTVRAGGTANVRVYATNYNVLRVMSGMGGLAYSN